MKKKFLVLSGILLYAGVFSQKTHTVVKGDTPYNISKKYGVSLEDLTKLNPSLKEGVLRLGEELRIDSKAKSSAPAAPVSSKTGTIVLQPKQTIYGLTKQYHISETDLRKLNPDLDSHMKIGDVITLPADLIAKYGDAKSTAVVATPVSTPATVVTPTETSVISENSYQVQPKDNYYKLTKKFSVSQQDLFALNPGLEAKGLQPGEVIIIKNTKDEEVNAPKATATTTVNEPQNTYTTTSSADDFVTYTVQSGDTVFGILNRFGITLDELLELNPDLTQGLKSGMVLKIKRLDAAYIKKSGDALNVVLMLPFGFESGDSKYRNLSLDFLTGAKLAIARNAASGQKLDIKVIDAGNESSFKNALIQINQDNTDLIIGPFFKSNVLDVLEFVKRKNIPVVAPFANAPELLKYNNLILIETDEAVYVERVAEEIKDIYSGQKIIIVADVNKKNAASLKISLEKKIKNPLITIVDSAADIKAETNMMTGQTVPLIAVSVSDDEGAGDVFANRLVALSKEVSGMKAFSMYYAPIFEKKMDELSQVNLVYLMDRKINTDGSFEKEILAAYRKSYCKIPSKYAVIGFDVVNDMLSRENKKGEIFRQMGKVQTQLATKFEFVKSKSGAYVNQGYRVVRLMPN